MTDRELLELAAKAAGMDGLVWRDDRASMFHYNSKMMRWYRDDYSDLIEWNPLTDDGDALRLAVKLKMQLDCELGCARTIIWFDGDGCEGDPKGKFGYVDLDPEKYRVEIQVRRNNRATGQMRRRMK